MILSKEQELELIVKLSNKESSRRLAVLFGISLQTVYNIAKRHGVQPRKIKVVAKNALLETCRRGSTVHSAAAHLGMSVSTATRELREQRNQGVEILLRRGRPRQHSVETANLRLAKYNPDHWASLGADDKSRWVEEVYHVLNRTPFPYPPIPEEKVIKEELCRLRTASAYLNERDEVRPQNRVGTSICSPFFPDRYKATYKKSGSAFLAWSDEKKLKRAIIFQLDHGDPVTPHRVLRALTLQCRTPGIFRPLVAKFIYEHYCQSGDTVWDPCAGYGGRLLGAIAAGVHYVGTDVDAETVSGNQLLAKMLGANAEITLSPAEQFTPPVIKLAFTSPPYFDRERYSQNESQSWRRHAQLDTWIENFLRPVADQARDALVADGALVLNIADLRDGARVVPLVEKAVTTIRASGFTLEKILKMPLAAINRNAPAEPLLVFKNKRGGSM